MEKGAIILNEKKPFYKHWWFIGAAALIVVVIFGSILDAVGYESEEEAQPKAEEATKPAEKKEEKPKEKPKPKTTVEKLEASNKVDKASLDNGILTIETEVKSFWDETSILKHDVYELFEEMAKGFEDKDVEKVLVVLSTAMVDNKGNEEVEEIIDYEYSRAAFEELNYDKFAEMAYSQSWRILNEADTYWIHPGIYTKVKDDYRKNLTNGPSKQ